MQGYFVVKDKHGKFDTFSPDMKKLEQTIQRASKDPGGIIREQQKETCYRMESPFSRKSFN